MSDVNWGLLGNGFNAMETLGAFEHGQDRRMAIQQAQAAQQKQATVAQLTQRAVSGDAQARQQLAGLDYERFAALDKDTHAKWKQDAEQLGQFALLADTPEKWDAYARQYVQMGHPEAAQYIGKFSPEARAAIIAQAGQAKELLAQQEAKWVQVGDRGVFDAHDPAAVEAMKRGTAGLLNAPTAPVGKLTPIEGGAPSQGGASFPVR